MRWTGFVALVLATWVCAVPAAPADASRSCAYANPAGAPFAVQFLRATGDTCDTARAIAHRIQETSTARRVLPRRVAVHRTPYDCTYRARVLEPGATTFVRCVRSARIVTMRLSRPAKPV
jgi:hypothetical protein